MNIKIREDKTEFKELKEGSIFSHEGYFCMKTHKIDTIGSHSYVNAISLIDGRAYCFNECDDVIPINNYEFIIRG